MAISETYLMDCMKLMARYPDNHFDLAVVDPPYGIGINNQSQGKGGGVAKKINYTKKNWDKNIPSNNYFKELKRVSKNQIIWGGNYFGLEASPCWIVWDKVNGETDFADCELAWTSFNTAVRKITWKWSGMLQQDMKNKEIRFHPTQKPVTLYEWIFKNYAKEGDKILDTHLGSGSSRIAANKAGLDFVGCEIDEEYFNQKEERYKQFISQLRMF